jgi:chromosome segregation ATPase
VSIKQTPSLNQWLKIGSIAFGVSCGCTLPFTRHLGLSALISLVTMPGAVASVMVTSRHHQQQGQRQLDRGKQRLQELQHRSAILGEQLQLRHKDRQEIELRISQLHNLAANLNDRIDRDRDRHQQLEQQLATLEIYCQTQSNLAANLDRKIQDKQACLLEVDTDLNSLKLELGQVQSAQIQVTGANIDVASALEQQTIALTDIQLQINLCSATKQELELQLQQLQDRKVVETENFDESIAQKHLLLHELDLAISDRQKSQAETLLEVDRLNSIIAEKTPKLAIQLQKLADTQLQLSTTELALQARQVELDELAATILATQIPEQPEYSSEDEQDPLSDRLLQRELKIAQLELSSRQAELDNLEFKLQQKLESISELDLVDSFQSFEPQPPIIDRDLDEIVCLDEWYDKFIDNPHLTVLKHIEKHGTITESEASKKLGNARSVRQFANKLEEYAQDLPFSIRVESSPKGNRYLKEDRN